MQDPSQGIQRELQPHVHLLSTYRFPQLPQIHPDKVAEWLLQAPKITRDTAPFYWTYLDRPVDGTILLVWQSLSLGLEFPSDGYVWTPQEIPFQIEVAGGYTLEMYQHKTGYAPGEPVATHTRRRYRLVSKFPQPGTLQPEPQLWIVHYGQAAPEDRVPSNVIPIDMRINQMMQTRAYLHSQGQIVQKDFMLSDRQNWPSIAFPRNQARGPMYGQANPPTRTPQTMAYPPQHPAAGPPSKRARTQAASGPPAAAGPGAVVDDDEEDTSRGDLFDHTTPREISMARYKQNHEWMEEILSSPYAINQIVPADLGLGMRGGLSRLTDGIFDAPTDPDKDVVKHSYVGRLDPEKAEQFRNRANAQIVATNKEIEKMKAKHAKRMAKLQKGSLFRQAEKELRTAVSNPADTGSEVWRLEGKLGDDDEDEEMVNTSIKAPAKVADIVAKVEASVGRHAAAVKELIRIQDGGYEEAPAVPSPPPVVIPTPRVSPPVSNNGSSGSGVLVGDADLDMSNSAAGLLDQYQTGRSSNATPGSNFPTPGALLQTHSSSGTPNNLHIPSPHPPPPQLSPEAAQPTQAPAESNGTGDWVVVPSGGVSPTQPDAAQQPASAAAQAPTPAAPSPHPVTTAATSAVNTPGMPDFTTSPNDFADLADLDTAGDALASYDAGDSGEGLGDLGMDMDMDVGEAMDDSAFGEAFHATPGIEEGGDGTPGSGASTPGLGEGI